MFVFGALWWFVLFDGFVDFLAVDGDVLGCLDAEADFVSSNIDYGDDDVVADHDGFVSTAAED